MNADMANAAIHAMKKLFASEKDGVTINSKIKYARIKYLYVVGSSNVIKKRNII